MPRSLIKLTKMLRKKQNRAAKANSTNKHTKKTRVLNFYLVFSIILMSRKRILSGTCVTIFINFFQKIYFLDFFLSL